MYFQPKWLIFEILYFLKLKLKTILLGLKNVTVPKNVTFIHKIYKLRHKCQIKYKKNAKKRDFINESIQKFTNTLIRNFMKFFIDQNFLYNKKTQRYLYPPMRELSLLGGQKSIPTSARVENFVGIVDDGDLPSRRGEQHVSSC